MDFWDTATIFALGVLAGIAVQTLWHVTASALSERRRILSFAFELPAALQQIENLGKINKSLIEAITSTGQLSEFKEFFPLANVHCPAGERLYAEGHLYSLLPYDQVFELRRIARFYTPANEQYFYQLLLRAKTDGDTTAMRSIYNYMDVAFTNDPGHIQRSIKQLEHVQKRGIAVYLVMHALATCRDLFRSPSPPPPLP